MNSPATTAFTSLVLKLIGSITIIAALLDYVVFAIPFNFQSSQWQQTLTQQYVDRGIVPLIGIVFLLLGYWIDGTIKESSAKKSSGLNLKLPIFLLSSLLGLLFLLLVPVHLSSLNQYSSDVLTQIETRASEGESRLLQSLELYNVLSQQPERLNQEIQRRSQVIESGKSPEGFPLNEQQIQSLSQQRDQLKQLLDLSKDPAQLEERLETLRNQLVTQVRDRKLERENQAKAQTLKRGLRIGLSSLLLSIGYITIGWFGLRGSGK